MPPKSITLGVFDLSNDTKIKQISFGEDGKFYGEHAVQSRPTSRPKKEGVDTSNQQEKTRLKKGVGKTLEDGRQVGKKAVGRRPYGYAGTPQDAPSIQKNIGLAPGTQSALSGIQKQAQPVTHQDMKNLLQKELFNGLSDPDYKKKISELTAAVKTMETDKVAYLRGELAKIFSVTSYDPSYHQALNTIANELSTITDRNLSDQLQADYNRATRHLSDLYNKQKKDEVNTMSSNLDAIKARADNLQAYQSENDKSAELAAGEQFYQTIANDPNLSPLLPKLTHILSVISNKPVISQSPPNLAELSGTFQQIKNQHDNGNLSTSDYDHQVNTLLSLLAPFNALPEYKALRHEIEQTAATSAYTKKHVDQIIKSAAPPQQKREALFDLSHRVPGRSNLHDVIAEGMQEISKEENAHALMQSERETLNNFMKELPDIPINVSSLSGVELRLHEIKSMKNAPPQEKHQAQSAYTILRNNIIDNKAQLENDEELQIKLNAITGSYNRNGDFHTALKDLTKLQMQAINAGPDIKEAISTALKVTNRDALEHTLTPHQKASVYHDLTEARTMLASSPEDAQRTLQSIISKLNNFKGDPAYEPILKDVMNFKKTVDDVITNPPKPPEPIKPPEAPLLKKMGDEYSQILENIERAEHPSDLDDIQGYIDHAFRNPPPVLEDALFYLARNINAKKSMMTAPPRQENNHNDEVDKIILSDMLPSEKIALLEKLGSAAPERVKDHINELINILSPPERQQTPPIVEISDDTPHETPVGDNVLTRREIDELIERDRERRAIPDTRPSSVGPISRVYAKANPPYNINDRQPTTSRDSEVEDLLNQIVDKVSSTDMPIPSTSADIRPPSDIGPHKKFYTKAPPPYDIRKRPRERVVVDPDVSDLVNNLIDKVSTPVPTLEHVREEPIPTTSVEAPANEIDPEVPPLMDDILNEVEVRTTDVTPEDLQKVVDDVTGHPGALADEIIDSLQDFYATFPDESLPAPVQPTLGSTDALNVIEAVDSMDLRDPITRKECIDLLKQVNIPFDVDEMEENTYNLAREYRAHPTSFEQLQADLYAINYTPIERRIREIESWPHPPVIPDALHDIAQAIVDGESMEPPADESSDENDSFEDAIDIDEQGDDLQNLRNLEKELEDLQKLANPPESHDVLPTNDVRSSNLYSRLQTAIEPILNQPDNPDYDLAKSLSTLTQPPTLKRTLPRGLHQQFIEAAQPILRNPEDPNYEIIKQAYDLISKIPKRDPLIEDRVRETLRRKGREDQFDTIMSLLHSTQERRRLERAFHARVRQIAEDHQREADAMDRANMQRRTAMHRAPTSAAMQRGPTPQTPPRRFPPPPRPSSHRTPMPPPTPTPNRRRPAPPEYEGYSPLSFVPRRNM